MADSRWGLCENCRKWILADSWDGPSGDNCPICGAAVDLVERAIGDALVLDITVAVPANSAEPAF